MCCSYVGYSRVIEDGFQCCALVSKKMKVTYSRRQGISLLDDGQLVSQQQITLRIERFFPSPRFLTQSK